MKRKLFKNALRRCARWKRFEQKGYSAFRSIGVVVAIGVVSVSTLASEASAVTRTATQKPAGAAVCSDGAADDTAPADTLGLDEVEVVATVKSLAQGREARLVNVVGRGAIEGAAATAVPDVLKLTPEVDVRQRGPHGVQTDISIDGGTFDQVTILLNGMNITSPQIGHYSADWPLELHNIDKMEILDGASSRIAGGSSLMGAINIVSHARTQRSLYAKAEGGSFGTFGAEASVGAPVGRVANTLSGSWRRSDGGTHNSAYRRGQAYWQGAWASRLADIDWQAGFSDLDHGANTFYSAAYPDQHDHLTRWVAGVSATVKLPVRLEPMVWFHRLKDHYQLVYNTSKGENFHRTDVWGARLNASRHWGRAGATTIGAEMRREQVVSTNLGRPREPLRCNDSINYLYGDARTSWSLHAEHNVAIGRWAFSGGLVAAANTGLDGHFRAYPGLDASYVPARGWRLFASWSKAFRMPTFTDLYYKSATHEGNRNLKPEQMQSWQLGASYESAAVTGRFHAFHHRGHNMLDWVMYGPDDVFHATGFDLRNTGLGVQASVQLRRWLGSRQPLETLSAGYTWITQKRVDSQPVYKSNYALEYLRHKLVVSLRLQPAKGLSATLSFRWQERNGSYVVYEGTKSTGRLRPYRPYGLLDLRVAWRLGIVTLHADATNLTNVHYHDFGSIPQPGIWVMGGLSLHLGE